MVKQFVFIIAAMGLAMSSEASIRVPLDLRNPFEVPDPVNFAAKADKTAAAAKANPAISAREKQFEKISEKLKELEVKGIAGSQLNPDSTTVLIGNYILKSDMIDMTLPSSDFDFKGLIRVVSVTPTQIVFEVSIELETRQVIIPLR